MARIPENIVEQIYNSADIVEIISDYMPLKKKGMNFWALSPFSNEKTPSFAVHPGKGIYKDFSSGKGGNAVNFLMEMEGYTYVEALKHIAQKYGIEIPEEEETEESRNQRDKRESLYIVNEFAARWFNQQLLETEDGKAIGLSYFKERGILQSTIESFQLGYSPDTWDSLAKAAVGEKYEEEYLLALGLCSRSEKTGNLIDRFRGRVMFPISNAIGKVVGFGGRILGDRKDIAKYINSSESDIYYKSQVLYGLYQAKQEIRNKDLCILTEGYMDTILLHQNGIKHVVASSGTALTKEQVRLIRRYTSNVLMIYDGDAAGTKAAMRGIDILIKEGMRARVLLLPGNHDPDSYIREVGPTDFMTYLETEALSFVDFKLRVLREGKDIKDPQVQTEIVKELGQTLANIPDLVQRQMFVRHVAEKLSITESLMLHAVDGARAELGKIEAREKRREQFLLEKQLPAEVKDLKAFEKLELANQEKELLRILINYHDRSFVEGQGETLSLESGEEIKDETEGEEIPLIDFFMVELEGLNFENQVYEQLKEQVFKSYDDEVHFNIHHYLNHEDPAISKLVSDLLIVPHETSPNWRKYGANVKDLDADLESSVKNSMYHYKYKKVNKLISENQQKLQAAELSETDDADQLLKVFIHLNKLRQAIGKKMGIEGAIKASDGRL